MRGSSRGEVVGRSPAPRTTMPCAVNGPTPGSALQLRDRLLAAQRAQALAVEAPLERGVRERADVRQLALGHAREPLELRDTPGAGKARRSSP